MEYQKDSSETDGILHHMILLNQTPQTCMGICFSGVVHYGSTNDH